MVSLYRYQFEQLKNYNALEPIFEERELYALREDNYDTDTHMGIIYEEKPLVM